MDRLIAMRGAMWLNLLCVGVMLCLASAGAAQERSVRPGVNDSFIKGEPSQFVERFEREGREVYDHRDRIVEAAGLRAGMAVADIGAGTGLFTMPFAERVGPTGRVYAVDIIAGFVRHVEEAGRRRGLENIVGVVCGAETVNLAEESIDVAFICDTYHHFEYPQKTMASIHRALKPGGRVVLIDFVRIEGESSEWTLSHVRAGQEVFTREIEEAGFRQVEEQTFLKDNYFVAFEKVEKVGVERGGAADEDVGAMRERFVQEFKRISMNTPYQDGMFLRMLILAKGAKRGVEVGSANGYGAVHMGMAFEETGGKLVTVEIMPVMARACRENIRRTRLEGVVECIEGDALEVLPKLEGPFDFVFLDARKQDYLAYLKAIEPKLEDGAVVVAHNATRFAEAMADYLEYVHSSEAYHTVIVHAVPEDGMAVSYFRRK